MVAPLYVSGLLLRVIQIGVKACIDVTLYAELFITSITKKHFLIPLRIIFDRSPVIHSWITLVPPCQTRGKAHIRCGTQHGILYRAYGWGIGDDLRPFSFFCCGRALSLTQLHTLKLKQELLLRLIHFELLQNHVKVCALWKSYQASWSISIDLDAQYVSILPRSFY